MTTRRDFLRGAAGGLAAAAVPAGAAAAAPDSAACPTWESRKLDAAGQFYHSHLNADLMLLLGLLSAARHVADNLYQEHAGRCRCRGCAAGGDDYVHTVETRILPLVEMAIEMAEGDVAGEVDVSWYPDEALEYLGGLVEVAYERRQRERDDDGEVIPWRAAAAAKGGAS